MRVKKPRDPNGRSSHKNKKKYDRKRIKKN